MKFKAFLFMGIISCLLIGCTVNDDDRRVRDDGPMGVRYNPNELDTQPNNVDQYNDRYTRNNNQNNNNNNKITETRNDNDNNMEVADEASERIANLKEVDSANVIVTNRNAYVAAVLADDYDTNAKNDHAKRNINQANDNVPKDVQDKIAKEVRKVNDDIDNVYVSVNPDFYDRMTGYADDIRNGQPISGFFDEFNETIQRVFPDRE